MDQIQLNHALKDLTKLVKGLRFYPAGHPALRAALQETLQNFAPLLRKGTPLICTIRRDGFYSGDESVGRNNPALQNLALLLFSRRIHHLMILQDLSGRDLLAFSRSLSLAPPQIEERGGIQEVLRKEEVSTLWVNEIELDKVLPRKKEIEEKRRILRQAEKSRRENKPGLSASEKDVARDLTATPPESHQEKRPAHSSRDLQKLLQELQRENSDQRYRTLLQELTPLVRRNLNDEGRLPVLRAFILLCHNSSSRRVTSSRREDSRHFLDHLASSETIDFLITYLCLPAIEEKNRLNLIKVLVLLREKSVQPLLDRLKEERDNRSRKLISSVIIRLGSPAIPALIGALDDDRWVVVRNAVFILGSIREEETVPLLAPRLFHPEPKVRQETLRALTRIGGPDAVAILVKILDSPDRELSRQVLLALAAIRSPRAVPALLRLLNRPDPFFMHVEMKKGAAKALGEIGSAEAVPHLIRVLESRRFWRRSRINEIRAAAAAALGEIGNEKALPSLEKILDDHSEDVSRAAANALKMIQKGLNG